MSAANSDSLVVGVDVGTGSARAGVFTSAGVMLGSAVHTIQTWKPRPDFVEQSSDDIWQAVCTAVREALKAAGARPEHVAGIGFDATCSLVVLDRANRPVAVGPEGDDQRNIIVWMDHRAVNEADAINAGRHEVLRYVGGRVSPEMETPKLKWLKAHAPGTWSRAGKFLDLADFLTYRATGADSRSLCTVVCKWTYLGHEGAHGKWDREFLDHIGIADAFDGERVTDDVRPLGSAAGSLTPQAADDLGLSTGCVAAIGIIDAHAGGLGLLGSVWTHNQHPDAATLETALALIGGTSNCHMAVSREPRFIDGIWGPYFGAMVPGMWLTEGGQSAAGSAIDHAIALSPNAPALARLAREEGTTVYELLNAEIARHAAETAAPYAAHLTRSLHVLPYFLGNRSPNADPNARAIIDGMTLDESISSQALLYYATIQAVAYGTRDIVRAMNEAGYRIDSLFVTGGGTKNPLWLQEHADATGLKLILPREPEAVLLGSAMLAAAGAGVHADLLTAMQRMSGTGTEIAPNPDTAEYHAAKFGIFREMYREQLRRRQQMAGV